MTPTYVEPTGLGVMCPSSTYLALLVKSILKPQTECKVTLLHAGGSDWTFTNTSKAILISVIYFTSVFPQGILIFSIKPILVINVCWHFNAVLVTDTSLYPG